MTHTATTHRSQHDTAHRGGRWRPAAAAVAAAATALALAVPVAAAPAKPPKPGAVVSVGLARDHVVIADKSGRGFAWGSNNTSQFGNQDWNAPHDSTTPVPVNGAPVAKQKIVQIGAGVEFSAALDAKGAVYVWGANHSGVWGNGTVQEDSDLHEEISKVKPGAAKGVKFTDISVGPNRILALGKNGTLYAWGNADFGALGTGKTGVLTFVTTPAAVARPPKVSKKFRFTAVSAGERTTVAVGNDGNLYAWGRNTYGELGSASVKVGTAARTPVKVATPKKAPKKFAYRAASAGVNHVVALGNDGNLYAWGHNDSGQLGDGSRTDRKTPVRVARPKGVGKKFAYTMAAAGDGYTIALGNDGRLYSWGGNTAGQLGNGKKGKAVTKVPTRITLGAGVKVVALAADHERVAAISAKGGLYLWGGVGLGNMDAGTIDVGAILSGDFTGAVGYTYTKYVLKPTFAIGKK